MWTLGVTFTDTIGLGSVVLAGMMIAAAGLPVRLMGQLRAERTEQLRINKEQSDEIAEQTKTIAELQARPDMRSLSDQNHELQLATIKAIQMIADSSRQSDQKLDALEAAVAGGMAAQTRELHKVATLLDKVAVTLNVNGGKR